MSFQKQTYKDVEFADLFTNATAWDLVQLKYDGHWCRLEFDSEGNGYGYSSTGNLETSIDCPSLANYTFIGEHIYGTNWAKKGGREGVLVLFDCVVRSGVDISTQPYELRHTLLSDLIPTIPRERLFVAYTVSISHLKLLWDKFVLGPQSFEGIVLRKWDQPYETTLHRCKRDYEQTYYAIGFVEGKGRLTGTLGAVIGGDEHGLELCRVGGGFSDEHRIEIWNNQEKYLNRQFDAVGKGLFESGALRHPNFLRWK